MTRAPQVITRLPHRLAVCRFDPDAPPPAWVFHASAHFFCVMRTAEELSVVCPEDDLPPSVERVERGFRAFKLEGPIPFDAVGVVAGLTSPLAVAGIGVFVLSTYDTDYLLVKEADLDAAGAELTAAGYLVR